jgi:hypothetical protein
MTIEAEEGQVSLNLLISHRLSLTATDPAPPGASPKPQPAPGPKRKKEEHPGIADDAPSARLRKTPRPAA